jgi:hypothetical protein
VVSEGSGSWLEYIEFDGKLYWSIDDRLPTWQMINDPSVPEEQREFLLPSDSRFRPDIKYMLEKNME